MKAAYRIPVGRFRRSIVLCRRKTEVNTPITGKRGQFHLITNVRSGQQWTRGKPVEVRGIAWDDGRGIAAVDVSIDGGMTWARAKLGADDGRYSGAPLHRDGQAYGRGVQTAVVCGSRHQSCRHDSSV